MKEKVVLAYSGGLDTTALIPWLKETFDYDVVCCCVNCGQGNELDGLEERAKLSGASKLYIEDIVDDFCDNYIMPCVEAGAVYEHKYLLGTSMARPAIAKKLVEIARKENAVAICHGATGKGNEIVRLLLGHKNVEVAWYGSRSYIDKKYAGIYQNFFKLVDAKCMDDNMEALADEVDVIFTATPQGLCASLVNEGILSRAKVIDLSADFRIKDVKKYEKWYGIEHKSPQFIDEAVYGLCEINREDIKKARLIANPGCYPTCSTLSIYPLLKAGMIDPNTIIIDAKSGTTGAGRGAKVDNLYCEVNENIKAYGVATHRHTPEIEDQLGYACGQEVTINFTPHLVPMNRGILVTAYASLTKDVTYKEVKAAYDACYENETFVRVLDKDVCPQTKWVEGSNYVDVNFKIDPRTHRIIMMGAIDNLVKGAAGQAVQNMNLMFGFDEAEGLLQVPMYP